MGATRVVAVKVGDLPSRGRQRHDARCGRRLARHDAAPSTKRALASADVIISAARSWTVFCIQLPRGGVDDMPIEKTLKIFQTPPQPKFPVPGDKTGTIRKPNKADQLPDPRRSGRCSFFKLTCRALLSPRRSRSGSVASAECSRARASVA